MRARRARGSAAMLLACLALSGCATVQVQSGDEVALAALEQLWIGESSELDIKAALGPPNGQGQAVLPFEETARSVWSYHFEQGLLRKGKFESQRLELLVFVKDGRYDGYLWFSTVPLHRSRPAAPDR